MTLTCYASLVTPGSGAMLEWSAVPTTALELGETSATTFSTKPEAGATNYLASAFERSVNKSTLNPVNWNVEQAPTFTSEAGIGGGGVLRGQSRVALVPEPGVALLLVTGLLGLVLSRRRSRS